MEVKIKPLISMLIAGSFLLATGTLIALWRRLKESSLRAAQTLEN